MDPLVPTPPGAAGVIPLHQVNLKLSGLWDRDLGGPVEPDLAHRLLRAVRSSHRTLTEQGGRVEMERFRGRPERGAAGVP